MATHATPSDPHAGCPVLTAGSDLKAAAGVLVMLHGRGAAASGMLALHKAINIPSLAALVPQAAGSTWYPNSFLAPIASNQPYLDSALARVERIVLDLLDAGIGSERIALMGFSQGACLACEHIARHPRRYGAVIALSGGRIGPDDSTWTNTGSLAGTPVFLGSSDPDAHVPAARVRATQAALERQGAVAELRLYPGMPHTINQEELEVARQYLQRMVQRPSTT